MRLGNVATSYGAVLSSRRYFPLWLGQLVSNFGDTLHYIALVVLVFQLSGQGLAVAGLVAAEVIPVLLLGPIAGVVIDRFSRKAVLVEARGQRRSGPSSIPVRVGIRLWSRSAACNPECKRSPRSRSAGPPERPLAQLGSPASQRSASPTRRVPPSLAGDWDELMGDRVPNTQAPLYAGTRRSSAGAT